MSVLRKSKSASASRKPAKAKPVVFPPTANSKWLPIGHHSEIRVLGVVEGQVVYRAKGSAAQVDTINGFLKKHVRLS